jgi:phosphatidylserine/phosphatidylglycerophosphate/cardiolipin synthase-like enzyme
VGTLDALQGLFAGACRTLKIFSPYVDASFTSLLRLARCPVRIVTTALERRRLRSRPVLERCALSHPLAVRYVSEIQGGAHIFQMHAKMVVADGREAYLGSANLTDTSLNYNLEVGVLIRDPEVAAQLERVFDLVFDKLSVPAVMLRA